MQWGCLIHVSWLHNHRSIGCKFSRIIGLLTNLQMYNGIKYKFVDTIQEIFLMSCNYMSNLQIRQTSAFHTGITFHTLSFATQL